MSANLEKAVSMLQSGGFTLVIIGGDDDVITSTERGVKPLLELLERGHESGFSAADKVIGKAAAFLYILLGAKEISAGVISEAALAVLRKGGIDVRYDTLVPAIRNRDNTGFCPMETAVRDTEDPTEALLLIRRKLSQLSEVKKDIV